MNGKGSGRRPAKVDDDTFASNWDRIFGKKEKETYVACDACHEEVSQLRAGDESFDYCEWCEEIVEGRTHTCYGECEDD